MPEISSFDSEVEDSYDDINNDDQVSCIVRDVVSSESIFSSHVSIKSLAIKAKYDYLGFKKTICTDVAKENSIHNNSHEDQLDEARIILWHKSKVSLGWLKNHSHGAGMINLGNTCYLNSSLQALFHIPSLANWLLGETSSHITSCENSSSCIGFCSICAMMRTIHTSLNQSANTIKPALIHNRLKSIGKTLQYGRQEDAHEFIKLLLDHMQRSYILSCRAGKLDHRSKETTPLHQIFGGYLRQQVICPHCRHVSTTFSHFQDIALDIRSVGNVDDALTQYFQKETLDAENAYKCENCKRRVPATKRYYIEVLPNVLLLQLKRFSISGGKMNKSIGIHEEINLTNYIWNNKKEREQSKYRLVSMVNHLGSSQHSGHYTAVARSPNGTMHEFDDNSVRFISMDNALHRSPYVLFYELVSKPKHNKIRQMGEIQVQAKNGFISHKSKLSNSEPGGSGILMPKEVSASKNGSIPLEPTRNRISFEIKLKSESCNRPMNGSISSTDIRSIGNTNVQTWDGRPSNTFEFMKSGYSNKRSAHDAYNDEYDAGKISKKKFKCEPVRRQDNPFQSYSDRRETDGARPWSGYRHNRHRNNQQRRNFHTNNKFKSHGSYGGGYHRHGGHRSNKPWQYRGGGGYGGSNEGFGHYKNSRT